MVAERLPAQSRLVPAAVGWCCCAVFRLIAVSQFVERSTFCGFLRKTTPRDFYGNHSNCETVLD